MKTTKSIGLFLLCIFCCINFTSCDPANNGEDDLIWDFSPIVLYISVQDAQGNDLLNPLTKGSIANQGIKAIYKGETYEKDAPLNERTRAYMAYFTGLQTGVSKDGKYYLTFGEFNGDHTFDNEKVEIDWNDGKEPSVITFSSKLTWKSKKEPVFDRKFCLNGQEIDQKQGLVITSPPSQSEQKFDIVAVEYGIDVETDEIKEKIKADLESKSPYTNGESYSISIQEKNSGTYTLLNSDGFPITKKEFAIEEAEAQKQGLVITRTPSQSEQKFDIVAVEYGIDVETDEIKEKIKADLESKSPYTNGESYSISIQEKNSGTYTLLNSDGFPITKKEFAIEEAEAHGMYGITTEIAKTCRLIPPDDQIYNHIKLKLGIDGEKSSNTFNIFIGRPYNFWIYEDLTEYYKDKYPDGKVKEIVRLLKSKPNNPTKQ